MKTTLTLGTDGALYDKRKGFETPIRKDYNKTFGKIDSLAQVKATLRAGEFAWPGGYQQFFVTSDGAALCFKCARKEFRQVAWDFLNKCSTGWKIAGCSINYEDGDLSCDHCSEEIPPFYGN